MDTFVIPPGAPMDPLKTRIIEIDEGSDRAKQLGQLATYDDVMRATDQMTHGAIIGMVNWCRVQDNGTTAKWQFKRVVGKIPLPWFSIISVIVLVYGVGANWSSEILGIGVLVMLSLFFITAFASTEYTNDAKGTCLICSIGLGDEDMYKKSISVYDGKGRKKQISKAGYCNRCHWNVYRKNLWTAAEASVWNKIQEHPVRPRRLFRLIGYKFFYWLGYYEECIDPRTVGRGQVYRKKDRWDPKDDIDENALDNVIRMSFLIVNEAQRAKRLRRKI